MLEKIVSVVGFEQEKADGVNGKHELSRKPSVKRLARLSNNLGS